MEPMLYIIWNKENDLGIPIIDEQHRGIVSTINSFQYFVRQGRGPDVLKPTLRILELYSHLHFITEEALMRRAEYPDYDDHVLLHGRLMEKTRLIARGETSDEEVEQALKFLRDWWLGHINTQDRKYAPAVKKLFA